MEPDAIQDLSYSPTALPVRTGGPSSADASVLNGKAGHTHSHLFTYEQCLDWIRRRLGADVWRLEGLHPGAIEDCVEEALGLYATRIPRLWWELIPPATSMYQPKAAAILGVVRMDFISPISSTGGYGAAYQWNNNLTGVGLVPSVGPGLLMPAGDLMRWVMARKSFIRVASLAPQWHYDPSSNLLHIYNPNVSHYAFALLTLSKTFAEVNPNHKIWLRGHALALARLRLCEIREKHDNAIQAPGGGTINVGSTALRSVADKDHEASLAALMAMQTRVPPIWGD